MTHIQINNDSSNFFKNFHNLLADASIQKAIPLLQYQARFNKTGKTWDEEKKKAMYIIKKINQKQEIFKQNF